VVRARRTDRKEAGPSVGAAVDAFLSTLGNAGTARNYAGTLRALVTQLGTDTPLAVLASPLAGAEVSSWFERRWGERGPPRGTATSTPCDRPAATGPTRGGSRPTSPRASAGESVFPTGPGPCPERRWRRCCPGATWPCEIGRCGTCSTRQPLASARSSPSTSVNWAGTCETVPPGWIAVQNVMYYWTGSAWEECRASGWIYNSATTSKKSPISSDWSGSCGLGYYDTVAYGEMWTGSAWSGGGLASGYVYWGGATGAATPVGATRPAGTPPTPAPPLGVALPSNP
jgi:hypothetical protein